MTEPELTPEQVRELTDGSADRALRVVRARLGDDAAGQLHGGVSAWFERWTLPDGSLDMEPGPPRGYIPPEDVMADFDEWAKRFASGSDTDVQ